MASKGKRRESVSEVADTENWANIMEQQILVQN